MRNWALILSLMATATGCEEFTVPAELDRAQFIALPVEQPIIAPGQRTTIEAIIAGPTGRIIPDDLAWDVVPATPGAPVLGTIEFDGNVVFIRAIKSVPEDVTPIAMVEVRATVNGKVIVGQKGVGIGDLTIPNPRVLELQIAGQASDGSLITLAANTEVDIKGVADPEPDDRFNFAWYTNVGTVERFRDNPSLLQVGAEAKTGSLFFVVRNGLGGTDWLEARVVVE